MPITPRTSRKRPAGSSGFTLVELLAVMLILAILITLVLGASKLLFSDVHSTETQASMQVIMAAITAYHDVVKDYPAQTDDWISQLASVQKSRDLIAKLGEKVWSAENRKEFRDAWGNKIKYTRSGGLAGAPGLISGGPDGDHSTEEDNVRYNR
ncbi:MAG: type II secretion system protein GspG [Phycisphaerae bacterium]|jgi:prepilin-type N-terminal cleavage/methylation domain-containing protein|nr:type II secretion system protein GspG [Phycisphaerae bacterium]